MSKIDADRLIMEEVEKHYETHEVPYYLAELGMFFRSENIDIPDSVRLKDYLKRQFAGRLVVVQDDHTPAKIAIAPSGKENSVRQQLSGQPLDTSDGPKIDYGRLPFALVAAFCKNPLPDARLYFRIAAPFRYEIRTRKLEDDNYIEIEERFRPQSLSGRSAHALSYSDKQTIYDHIRKWADEKSIDLRSIYYDLGAKSTATTATIGEVASNALQRLIDAQEPELRGRILIPGDIANTLMRMP